VRPCPNSSSGGTPPAERAVWASTGYPADASCASAAGAEDPRHWRPPATAGHLATHAGGLTLAGRHAGGLTLAGRHAGGHTLAGRHAGGHTLAGRHAGGHTLADLDTAGHYAAGGHAERPR